MLNRRLFALPVILAGLLLQLAGCSVKVPPPTTDSQKSPGPSAVVGRHIFYNNSSWDAATPESDGNAIATDKTALLPGQTATIVNYTSYYQGINGIMIDIANLSEVPSLAEYERFFSFRVGGTYRDGKAGDSRNTAENTWEVAPAPLSLNVLPGAGKNGADRIVLIWEDRLVRQQWLQVTVLSNSSTGLDAPDIHYWGNSIGDSGGNPVDGTRVNIADVAQVTNNRGPTTIDSLYDHNRDKVVDDSDVLIVLNDQRSGFFCVQLISIP